MANRIQLRRDTATNWAAVNPVLTQGEVGLELTTGKIKIGNGVTAWNSLPYFTLNFNDLLGAPAIPTTTSQLTNDSGYITAGDLPGNELPVNAIGYLFNNGTGTLSWDSVVGPTALSQLDNDLGFITAAAIPTNLSELSNDVGFITATDRLTSGTAEVVLVTTGPEPYTLFPAISTNDQIQIVGAELGSISGNLTLTSQVDTTIISNGAGVGGGSNSWTFGADGTLTTPGGMSITGVGATIQALTGNSINIETNDTQSVSANCAIAVGDEFVADTEFNDDITVVQVGWTVTIGVDTYVVTSIDPAPPANQYRITATGATFVQGTTYTFTSPTPVAKTWSFGSTGVLTTPGLGTISHQNNDLKFEVSGTDVIVFRTDGGDTIINANGSLKLQGNIIGFQPDVGYENVVLQPSEAVEDRFLFYVDQTNGTFNRAGMEMPVGYVDKAVTLGFPHDNSTIGYIFNQGTDTVSGTELNNALNIMMNAGDVRITALSAGPIYTSWTFKQNGSLEFPDSTVQTTAFTGSPASILDLGITDGTLGQVLTANGDGTFSFTTVSGVSNTLDGLTDVAITTPANGEYLTYNNGTWVNTALLNVLSSGDNISLLTNDAGYLTSFTETDPVFTASEAATITSTDTANWDAAHSWGDHSTAGYLIPTINTTTGTTGTLVDGGYSTLNLTGGRAYVLYKIQTSSAAWVRVYTNELARTADAGRLQGVDPGANSGVIAEAITAGAETVVFAPAVNGFNDESPTTDVMPVAITNISGGDAAITVTVTKLTMVA